jgi:Helix-turn-helix domain
MSNRAITWAFEVDYPGMFLSEHHLLVVLADYADENDECWPSTLALMTKGHMGKRTIEVARRRLKEAGIIRVRLRSDQSSLYWLNLRWQLQTSAYDANGAHVPSCAPGAESAGGGCRICCARNPS